MWFLGLIIGGLIGAIGGGAGAVMGAVAGAGVGWAWAQNSKGGGDERLARLEASIRYLQERVAALERAPRAEAKPEIAPVTEKHEPSPAEAADTASQTPSPVTPHTSPKGHRSSHSRRRNRLGQIRMARPSQRNLSCLEPLLQVRRLSLQCSGTFSSVATRWCALASSCCFSASPFCSKYASEQIEISIEARLIGVALGALVMLGIGWHLRESRPGYGLIMQGGGIGVLYITVFAAFRLYQLLPAGLVFALLAAMAVFSAMLAVLQDSRSLAAMGVSGGFLRADPGFHRRGQPRRPVQFLRVVQFGHSYHRLVQSMAVAQPARFRFYFLHWSGLGRSLL